MKQNGLFFLDILSIALENSMACYIQAPDLEETSLVLSRTNDPALRRIEVGATNMDMIEKEVQFNNIQDFMTYIVIKNNTSIIFEGYDGLNFGIFSKYFCIPDWFRKKYEHLDIYGISSEW